MLTKKPPGAFPRFALRLRSRRVRIEDSSMSPLLEPGDRVLVEKRAFLRRLPQPGEIVMLADPERQVRWLVKRVTAVDPVRSLLEVEGENASRSRDSRAFGPVPISPEVGRVYFRYWPPDRRGPLPGRKNPPGP